jgi:excisionase family DNA binding protein
VNVELRLTPEQVEQIAQRVAELLSTDRPRSVDQDGYLNADQAAAYLACPKGRIYDLVQLRRLRPVRDGRRVLFRRCDLDAYLEGQ